MAGLKSSKFPQPKSGADFEELCLDLYRRVWNDPGAQLHGRLGQAQNGVDIFGRPAAGLEYHGVQCRNSVVTPEDLKLEVAKADAFFPRLGKFTIATTSANDVTLQEVARELTVARLADGRFPVDVVGWGTIEGMLAEHLDVVAAHFPELGIKPPAGRPAALFGVEWQRLPGAPRYQINPGQDAPRETPDTIELHTYATLVGGDEPGDLRVSWSIDGGDEVAAETMVENGPRPKRSTKPVTFNVQGEDEHEVTLRLRFLTTEGEHGYRFWFPLRRRPNGLWSLEAHEGSTTRNPEPF